MNNYKYSAEAFDFISNIFKKNNEEVIKKDKLIAHFNTICTELELVIGYYNTLLSIENINNHNVKLLNILKTSTNTKTADRALTYLVNGISNIASILKGPFIVAVSKCCSTNIIVTSLSGSDLIALKVLEDMSKIVNYSLDFINIVSSLEGTMNDYKSYKENIERDIFSYITLIKNYLSAFKDIPREMMRFKGQLYNPEVDDISVGSIIFNNSRSDLLINSTSNFTYNPIYRWKLREFDKKTDEYRLNHIKRQNIENKLIVLQQQINSENIVDVSRYQREIEYYNNELAVIQGRIARYEEEVEEAYRH